MNEQQYINLFFERLKYSPDTIEPLVHDIERKFKNSVALVYYTGYYYDSIQDTPKAHAKFKKCIELSPYFSHPYLHLANYHIKRQEFSDALKYLLPIYCKRTVDMTSGTGKRTVNFKEQVQITKMICSVYMNTKDYASADKVLTKAKKFLLDNTSDMSDPMYTEGIKYICMVLGEVYMFTDPDKAYDYYHLGLIKGHCCDIDKSLLSNAMTAIHYASVQTQFRGLPVIKQRAQEIYKTYAIPAFNDNHKNEKIRIGYISPDFNKNAVGLFVTHFLKHFDHSKFEVFVYYTNKDSDNYTNVFKSYSGVTWSFVATEDDTFVYNLIKFKHRIDILVDLIGAGHGNRMELLSMSPANCIINYLGYPGTCAIPQVHYRLVDHVTDPKGADRYTTEKLIYMPRSFVCFHLFDNTVLPDMTQPMVSEKGTVFIGVMNKTRKHHPTFIQTLKCIFDRNPNVIMCLKHDEMDNNLMDLYSHFDQSRIRYLPFTRTLESYLKQYNNIHFCIDTFPYSGTTTTCTSLLMGVPVYTIYEPSNPHVSNVSASILKNCGLDQFVCKDIANLVEKVQQNVHVNYTRDTIRKAFLDNNDSLQFTREYENLLISLVNTNTSVVPPKVLSI